MFFSALRSCIPCCKVHEDEEPTGPTYDETTHLIPIEIEPPDDDYYSDTPRVDYRKLYAQFQDIIRSKEGKMVNVASPIPFNLHNQVLPKEQSYSTSRSTSCSMDGYHDERYHPLNAAVDPRVARRLARRQKEAALATSAFYRKAIYGSRSPSPSGESTSRNGRSCSRFADQPRPTPLFNARLVGYKDTQTRGRTKQRGPVPSGLPSSSHTISKDEGGSQPRGTTTDDASDNAPYAPRKPLASTFTLTDTGPLIMSWGD
ncbi:hypothetical protein CPC08DRAFT_714494 [Agrocybe pediades]|nr:hypothetical protein CPC08DRAFT_714494 [Agrocybe pediades]